MRTHAERQDQYLAWARADEAFFAAGACHILAFRFLCHHAGDRHHAVLLHPTGDLPGSHVYVSDGVWAFDFNGWTLESLLLATSTAECNRRWPAWGFEPIEVREDLDAFCERWSHRPPADFPFDVTKRADRYLERFPPVPPLSRNVG